MPKLSSQFKHKEPELNSSLQIISQKERRAKSEKYGTLQEFLQGYEILQPVEFHSVAKRPISCALFTFQPCDTVPAARLNFYLFVPLLFSSHFVLVTVNYFC